MDTKMYPCNYRSFTCISAFSLIGKVVVSAIKEDIISSVRSLKVFAGHEVICETAVHVMHSFFNDEWILYWW